MSLCACELERNKRVEHSHQRMLEFLGGRDPLRNMPRSGKTEQRASRKPRAASTQPECHNDRLRQLLAAGFMRLMPAAATGSGALRLRTCVCACPCRLCGPLLGCG
jgi:hypothetical protein